MLNLIMLWVVFLSGIMLSVLRSSKLLTGALILETMALSITTFGIMVLIKMKFYQTA
jgi:hypothetical protein